MNIPRRSLRTSRIPEPTSCQWNVRLLRTSRNRWRGGYRDDGSMLRRWKGDRCGQALLEFALVMPILLFLLFAILTVGWWMNTQQVLASAALMGARQGVLTNDNGQIQGAVAQAVAGLDPGTVRTSIMIAPSDAAD